MLKHIWAIFLFLTMISLSFGAQIDIRANVYTEYTLFTYNINFNEDENYKSFSFEKPTDAKLDYAVDDLGNTITISFAGDYYILQPIEDTRNRDYEIRFVSKSVSENIISKKSFSQYTNFNFPVERLIFNFKLENNFGPIEELYPRNYEMVSDNEVHWDLNKVGSDTLFLVNFQDDSVTKITTQSSLLYWLGWIILITILLSLVFIYLFIIRKKDTKDIIKAPIEKSNEIVENKIDNNKYEEIVSKYLTENEKEIVEVVKKNPGISQYDILNYLPTMTKSNLSKIISKLNSKRILSRIRVGKVNKIYLGEKLEKENTPSKEK